MKLILGGGGDSADSIETDILIKNLVSKKNKRILYVPIALRDHIPFEDCYKWFTNTFSPEEFEIEMLVSFKDITFDKLKTFDLIFIGGGNTYNLLSEIRENEFDKLLERFSETSYIYGGSAGAIILGKDITTTPDENKTNLKIFHGLGFIDFCIWPHYSGKEDKEILNFVSKKNMRVIAIPEKTGVYISEGVAKVIDSEPIKIFSEKEIKTIHPGESFLLK